MSATIHTLPRPRTSDDISAAAKHHRRIATLIEIAASSSDPKQAFALAADEAQALLFHLSTLVGDPSDLPFRNQLCSRLSAKDHHNG